MNRLKNLAVGAILISFFGPYVYSSLNLIHFIIYTLFVVLIFLNLKQKKKTSRFVLYFLLFQLFITGISFFMTALNYSTIIEGFNIGGSIEKNIQIFVIAFLTTEIFTFSVDNSKNASILFLNSIRTYLFLLSCNTFLMIVQILTQNDTINNIFLPPMSDNSAKTVSALALENGRYGGVFNQPLESGVAYSIGLILFVYLLNKERFFSLSRLLIVLLIIIGGLLSVSKVFFPSFVIIFLIYFLSKIDLRILLKPINIFFFCFFVFLAANFLGQWSGFDYLNRLVNIDPNSNILDLFSAGRFGSSESQVTEGIMSVYETNILFGFGYGHFLALDNAFFAYFATSGIIGLMLYLYQTMIFLRYAFLNKSDEQILFFYFFILYIVASLGASLFLTNRASSIFLFFLFSLSQILVSAEVGKTRDK